MLSGSCTVVEETPFEVMRQRITKIRYFSSSNSNLEFLIDQIGQQIRTISVVIKQENSKKEALGYLKIFKWHF
jgi:hypothetical protein